MSRPRQARLKTAYPSYKGGRTKLSGSGHILEEVFCSCCEHYHFAQQHRIVVEDHLGRKLIDDEVVHHINECKTDNRIENLQIVSRREHARIHNQLEQWMIAADLTEDRVREALQGRTTLEAAEFLGVNHNTLRNRFPHLLSIRRSPHNPFDPHVIELVRVAAQDNQVDIKTFARQTGISAAVSKRICEINGFEWIRKSRKGEKRRQYRRRTTIPSVSVHDDPSNGFEASA